MSRFFTIAVVIGLAASALLATATYRYANPGLRLYYDYFSPEPAMGYGTTRAAVAAPTTGDQAILDQGKLYHQNADFPLAYAALSDYLHGNPQEGYLPRLLAATAAMAGGEYAAARGLLQELPSDNSDADGAALWYLSLLDLREENIAAARGKLEILAAATAGSSYPVAELLGRLPAAD